jgi:hypothetical protein
MQSRILRCAISFCLVTSAVGACRTSAETKLDQQTDKPARSAVPSPLVPAEPPARFASKWEAANWKARKAALAASKLVEVRLEQLQVGVPPRVEGEQWTGCPSVEKAEPDSPRPLHKTGETKVSDAPQLVFHGGGEFVVSADGVLHCLMVEPQSLGMKEVPVDGHQPNCSGGAYQKTEPPRIMFLYKIPAGVQLGKSLALRVPSYDIVYRYKESCPPLP